LTKFTFTSTNPAVGTIDSTGLFKGKMNGSTDIIATCSNLSDTCHISVESTSGNVSFDALENLNGWTFTNNNLDSLSVTLTTDQKSVGDASFKIDYKLTYDSQKSPYMIYLNKDILVYGIPDSIFIDVKSDGRKHKLYYRFSDVNEGIFKASGKKYLSDSLRFDKIHAPMLNGLVQVSGSTALNYPITLKRIEIEIAADKVQGKITSGTIYVDNLRLKYPGSITGVERNSFSPYRFYLEQNYPNPFNPSTRIKYSLPQDGLVSLKVFDILGREVATLIDEEMTAGNYETGFSAKGGYTSGGNAILLSSGIYFYRLATKNFVQTRKMIFMK